MVAMILIEFEFADARSYIDRVLREVADRLVHSVREVDTVARLGEKDFAIVVTNIHKREDGTTVIEKLFEVLSIQFDVETSSLEVPFRVGMSFYPPHGHDAAALLAACKQALARAEWASGRNVVVYEDT
jgi:diguanylate cyclase (GGDEF)-like protein